MIGDADPEDAFDASDPPDEQLHVLEHLADQLEQQGFDGRSAARIGWADHVVSRLDGDRARHVARRLHRLAEQL